MKCISCGIELRPESVNPDTNYQFDNALWVGFFGGYGMFVDDIETEFGVKAPIIQGSAHEAVLCHECAHKLCVDIPWIGKLLQPETSHSHLQEFWKENPDHVGWDNPKNRAKND